VYQRITSRSHHDGGGSEESSDGGGGVNRNCRRSSASGTSNFASKSTHSLQVRSKHKSGNEDDGKERVAFQ
jgi:hypothetical protein